MESAKVPCMTIEVCKSSLCAPWSLECHCLEDTQIKMSLFCGTSQFLGQQCSCWTIKVGSLLCQWCPQSFARETGAEPCRDIVVVPLLQTQLETLLLGFIYTFYLVQREEASKDLTLIHSVFKHLCKVPLVGHV